MPGGPRRVRIALLSGLAGVLIFAIGFELIQDWRYERWRARYDNAGWFEKITRASPNPVLMWEYAPHRQNWGISTNNHGFRDRDWPSRDKPAGVLRIAFVGDSVTLGLGVPVEDTFVRRLERAAAERVESVVVETMNFGVDGYNILQVHELLRTIALDFSPDAVVYGFCLNDFDFVDSSGEKIRYFKKPASFLLEWLSAPRLLQGQSEYHQFYFERNHEQVFAELEAMGELMRERGVPFLVAILPAFRREEQGFEDYSLEQLHVETARHLESIGLPYVDLLDAFRAHGRAPAEIAESIWHPGPEGHRVIAEALVEPVLGELCGLELRDAVGR